MQLVLRNNGKILPKENLEFYEYVAQQNVEKSAGVTDAKAGFKIPENDKNAIIAMFWCVNLLPMM